MLRTRRHEAGCSAHARRKCHELWANHGSPVGEQALKYFGKFYAVERASRN
ncbi:transposase [Variovorax sp. J22P271]|uniref:IS66 family transposase n=1 Tax=Variovorax davisae TaxID=3053515 RepID=UPI002575CBD1|nr:transposase [Variovorax sp. J22P271]MDM0032483.1 transposase [Variovorax sp. J22P271]